MENKENIFKRWWKLAQPSKKYLFGQTFFFVVYAVLLCMITIFTAKTINCMYEGDWKGAFTYLAIELITIVLRCLSMHIQYKFYNKQIYHIRHLVAKKIYSKILSCKDANFKDVSKEKVINIALNNMSYLSEFPDTIAGFMGYVFQVLFILVTVFISNYWAGIIIVLLGIINFFAYYFFNKKLGRIMLKRYEKKDIMFKSYSKVLDGKEVITELHSEGKYEDELIGHVDSYSKTYAHYYTVTSHKAYLYFIFWNVIVYAIAALMLFFVSNGSLDIAIYLIIVPYLSSCTEKLNALFDKTTGLENMRVDVDRVNLILNLSDEELAKYGEFNKEPEGYNLGLIDVSATTNCKYGLKNADISFKMDAINVIKGPSGSGKRVVFDLLRRYIQNTSGKVLLDNLDLFNYNEKTFKSHIDYCASHPIFINGTIKENLLLVEKNFKKIQTLCEEIEVIQDINNLPNGFETQITQISSLETRFLIGLIRALLSNSKILMIYELPQDVQESFRQKLIEILLKLKNKTIILFTHTDEYDSIADLCYVTTKGNVKLLKATKSSTGSKPNKASAVTKSQSATKTSQARKAKEKPTTKKHQAKKTEVKPTAKTKKQG